MAVNRDRNNAMQQLKIHFISANKSKSTAFKAFDEFTLKDALMKIPDRDERIVIKGQYENLHNQMNIIINELKDDSLSKFKAIYPIKCEIDLCQDEFSMIYKDMFTHCSRANILQQIH